MRYEENKQSQQRYPKEIIQEMVQLINNNDVEKAAKILRDNLDITNMILEDAGLQDALRNYYKPSEELSIFIGRDDYSGYTITQKFILDLILRDKKDFYNKGNYHHQICIHYL